MSNILDRKSAGYSFVLHLLQKLEHQADGMALQGGLGIALAIDHTRATGDIDMSVSARCLAKLEAELPAQAIQLFSSTPRRWTRCVRRDPELHVSWGGKGRSRRLKVSWWCDDLAYAKEHVEFEFYVVPDIVLRQYPSQFLSLYDEYTRSSLEFMMRMPSPASAMADKVTAIINSKRLRLIDYVDASGILSQQSEGELTLAARALETILSAYTEESIDDLLRKCLTNRTVIDQSELTRQLSAIGQKISKNRLIDHAGDTDSFNSTRSTVLMTAFAMLVGAGYIRGGGPAIDQAPRPRSNSFGM